MVGTIKTSGRRGVCRRGRINKYPIRIQSEQLGNWLVQQQSDRRKGERRRKTYKEVERDIK